MQYLSQMLIARYVISAIIRLFYILLVNNHSHKWQYNTTISTTHYYAPPIGKGAFVCLSVRPSVVYIANNLRTQRPSMPKFGTKVPHLRCDSHTSFKVKRSKVRVTRPINVDTHRAPYLPNANLPHTAGCCCLACFSAISVSICTKLARSIPLIRDRNCNGAQFSKITCWI